MERGDSILRGEKKLIRHPVRNSSAKRSNHRILFWNVQGLATKVSELNEYLSSFSIILLVETFIEEKNAKFVESSLPKKFKWFWSFAVREKARGRPWGGQLIGVAKDISHANYWQDRRNCCNGIEVILEGGKYNITNVYNRNGVRNIRKMLSEHWENHRNQKCIVLGDWNARVGVCGQRTANESSETRATKDTECNQEGENLMELLEEQGFFLLNGNVEGDWSGEITHVGYRSQSVIDYGAANEIAWPDIREFKVADKDQSDHFPLEVTLATRENYSQEHHTTKWIQTLSAKNKDLYQRRLKAMPIQGDEWKVLADAMSEATPRHLWRERQPDKSWWDEECYDARKENEKALRNARRDGNFHIFYEVRKRYKRLIRDKKREAQQKIIDELSRIKNMTDAWKFINKHSIQKKSHNLPSEEELCNHFTEILQAGPEKMVYSNETRNATVSPAVELTTEEFEGHVKKLKLRKAAGPDDLKAESIVFADEETKTKIHCIVNRCLQGHPIPQEWRAAKIFPLHKKGDPQVASNYRGIALVNSIYKLYSNILAERLTAFVEERNILPDCQNGFRKRRSAIDNIYILNTCIQTTLAQSENVYAFFVDYKAAFDKVDRRKLFKKMRKLHVPQYIVDAIEDIYKETPYIIGSKCIWTATGLRQGCPLSPLLFAIYIHDLENIMNNWQSGGIKIGSVIIRCLEYADDIVILSKDPKELKDMIGCLTRYSENRGMIISTEKSKVLRFSRGGRRSTQKWTCGGAKIEEVSSFTYLGFTFQCNGSFKKHIEVLAARGRAQVSRIWSIAERKFTDNFIIRRKMYESLVESNITYGSELFGFEERTPLERVMRMYLRWTMGVAPWTRVNRLLEEAGCTPVFLRTARRAVSYELKARCSPCQTLKECVAYNREPRNAFAVAKIKYYNSMGFASDTIADMIENDVDIGAILQRRHMDQFAQTQAVGGEVRPFTLPGYLLRGTDFRMVARFRLGNETRAEQSWRTDKTCRVCQREDETMDHVIMCSGVGGGANGLLHESGRGRHRMLEIIKWREANKL